MSGTAGEAQEGRRGRGHNGLICRTNILFSDFGPSTAKSTWGCGMLSKFPIASAKHIVLPSPEGELACLIDAIIIVDDQPVSIQPTLSV